MPEVSNVSTGKPKTTGALFRAPKGTPLPTSASATLNGAFNELGYASDAGVTNSNSPNTTTIKEWGGQTVLTIASEKPDTWKVKLIESKNGNVLETVYGEGNVTIDGINGTISVAANADETGEHPYVIDTVMSGGALKRIVIPCGELAAVGDIVYSGSDAIGYEVTINALPDASGNTHYEYIQLASGTTFALAIDKSTASVAHGSTTQITATTTPAGGHVYWGTSDASKATVDQSGLVTGVAAGSAVITAMYAGISKSCTVTVT